MQAAHAHLSRPVQRWIHRQGWRSLRPAQEAALLPILEGARDVVIAAGTAAGKTEAAFLPILSRLNQEDERGIAEAGCRVLYLAPLKALINDQFDRLERMTEGMEIPVVRWHGDASQSKKRAFAERPDGILQITPESLEAILAIRGTQVPRIFAGLRYVVVDELHAFIGSERGKQLQSLLHRVERAIGRRVPRIGLSATLGDMAMAASFLRPGAEAALLIEETGDGQDILLQVRGYRSVPPNPQALARGDADPRDRSLEEIANHLFKTLRGSNNLIFANRRQRVEVLADSLRKKCETLRVPNEFWPHHGSLAKELREQVEEELHQGLRPVNVVCTSTLEMGIDIGWVRSVAQVGVPPSVASMRQRLGRSGRRGEPATLRVYIEESDLTPKSSLYDRLRVRTVQTVAMVRLLAARWIEPPRVDGLHLSTLVHQVLALIAQHGGVTAQRAWDTLCHGGPFTNVNEACFIATLRAMGEHGLIEQAAGGVLLHGPVGERIVNHYSFFTVFPTPEEYSLFAGNKRIGSLPIDRPLQPESFLIFAGRRWRVVRVDSDRREVGLEPAPTGNAPVFGGEAGLVEDRIREEMQQVYLARDTPAFLDQGGCELLAEGRAEFERMDLATVRSIEAGREAFWFTWKGDRYNDTLVALLLHLGVKAENSGPFLTLTDTSPRELEAALHQAYEAGPPDAVTLAKAVLNKVQQKYDPFLSEDLLCRAYASLRFDGTAIPTAITGR